MLFVEVIIKLYKEFRKTDWIRGREKMNETSFELILHSEILNHLRWKQLNISSRGYSRSRFKMNEAQEESYY